jgi:hypothetical protein
MTAGEIFPLFFVRACTTLPVTFFFRVGWQLRGNEDGAARTVQLTK